MYDRIPSGRRSSVRWLTRELRCSGSRWYFIASSSSSLQWDSSRTSASVSTQFMRNSRLTSGSRTCDISSDMCFLRSLRSCFTQFSTAMNTFSSEQMFSWLLEIKSCTWYEVCSHSAN
uniref:Uncharacterized protein n=1 Tax=Anopheles coluzzii TaxID=1518534 RepID=A0A8W7PJ69_ANOCL